MADETPKPKSKRRRWIIAGVLLFVAGSAGWWNWPRGDGRFVGKWAAYTMGSKKPEATFTLGRNGGAYWDVVDGTQSYTVWSSGEQYMDFGMQPGPVSDFVRDFAAWTKVGKRRVDLHNNRWEIVSITPDTIELVRPATKNKKRPITLTLRRIPD